MVGHRLGRRWRGPPPVDPAWAGFLARFHAARPGITEDTLGRARSGGTDPYRWLLEPLPGEGRVLDLACGSGPLLPRGAPAAWVGVDRSGEELHRARGAGATALVRAEAGHLPFPDASVRTVVSSMALMLLQPLGGVLDEIARVLEPGGVALCLVPGSRAVTPSDVARYATLLATLRLTHLAYPNGRVGRIRWRAGRAGLRLVDDRHRRFELPIRSGDDAALFVRSLYLPGTDASRIEAACGRAAAWSGGAIGIPLRRLVMRRDGPAPTSRSGPLGSRHGSDSPTGVA